MRNKKVQARPLLIKNNLKVKYGKFLERESQTISLVSLHVINSITNPQSLHPHYRIKFDEIDIESKQKQYCKRYYRIQEYLNKNQALTQYYKFHHNYPYHLELGICCIMMNYQEHRGKYQRRLIKKIMNQPTSISEMDQQSNSGSSTYRYQRSNKKSLSIKLKELNLDSSSVMLQSICQKINFALKDVKPLYFYRGAYDDGVRQFKRFISEKKNKKIITGNQEKKKATLYNTLQQTKVVKKEQKINKGQAPKQSEQKGSKRQSYFKNKFQLYKNIKKQLNMCSNFTLKTLKKTEKLSRLKRNKTLTIKPQSLSKTTENQTISKQENVEQGAKKKAKSSIRIRDYKILNKFSLQKNKSGASKLNTLQIQRKNGQNQSKSHNIQRTSKSKPKIQSGISKSKRILKRVQQKPSCQRSLSKKELKQGLITNLQKREQFNFEMTKQNALNNLIKSKLKLRA